MLRQINVVQAIRLPCKQEQVLPIVWDLKNIEYCEVKANDVQVTKESAKTGSYKVHGHFAWVVPWSRTFTYQLHERGFHSKEANFPASSIDIQGGFIVEATNEQECLVIHYEQYNLPGWFVLLKPLIVEYLKWSQWKELRDFKKLVWGDSKECCAGGNC